jgi:hypothetical protein
MHFLGWKNVSIGHEQFSKMNYASTWKSEISVLVLFYGNLKILNSFLWRNWGFQYDLGQIVMKNVVDCFANSVLLHEHLRKAVLVLFMIIFREPKFEIQRRFSGKFSILKMNRFSIFRKFYECKSVFVEIAGMSRDIRVYHQLCWVSSSSRRSSTSAGRVFSRDLWSGQMNK